MKQYPGYTLVKREDCPEQHGTLTVLTHDVSGAAVLLVENDDDNKAFGPVLISGDISFQSFFKCSIYSAASSI